MGAAANGGLPDLISAVGVGGTEGYIRKEDYWVPIPEPGEGINLLYMEPCYREVPVYAIDNATVVDTFRLWYGYSA